MLGTCREDCSPVIPGLRIAVEGDHFCATDFTLKALEDPMSEDPFDYPDGSYAPLADVAAGGVTFTFDGDNLGCGVEEVTCTLTLTADASAGGAPARRVQLAYQVELGPLYLRKGHDSWSGKKTVWIKRRAQQAADAAA